MISGNEVKTRLGKLSNGMVIYDNLETVIQAKVPVIDTSKIYDFTLYASSDNVLLNTGNHPAGLIHITGENLDSLMGGISCAKITGTLGTAELTTSKVSGRIINMVKLTDSNMRQAVVDNKYVFGLYQTTQNDSDALDYSKVQLSFVTFDINTKAFVLTALSAGKYYYDAILIYNLGMAANANKLHSIIGMDNYIANLLPDVAINHGYMTFVSDKVQSLEGGKIEVEMVSNTNSTLANTADTILTGTVTQEGSIKAKSTSINKKAQLAEDIAVYYNGVLIRPKDVIVTASNRILIDIVDSNNTDVIGKGDKIEVIW